MHACVRTPHPNCPSQRLLGCASVSLSIGESTKMLLNAGLDKEAARPFALFSPGSPTIRGYAYASSTSSTHILLLPQDTEAACLTLWNVAYTKLYMYTQIPIPDPNGPLSY